MFVRTYAGAIVGIDAVRVTVEVNLAGSGMGLFLVGLPDSAVKESEERIRAAFENCGRRMSGRKTVVNLAPADLRKEGAASKTTGWRSRCFWASCRSTAPCAP